MTITVQPVDGLINRLLQQNSRPSSAPQAAPSGSRMSDHVSISAHARDQMDEPETSGRQQAGNNPVQSSEQKPARGKALESHLLDLYRLHDGYGG